MRAASIKDVARHAGVAVGTVSNVLNYPDRVSPNTLNRVQSSIAELGFIRNDVARQLRAGQSRTIGLVVPDIGNPFFTELARAAEAAAEANGSVLVLGNSGHDPARELHYIDLFNEQRVQGLLISPSGDPSQRLSGPAASRAKVVLVDAPSPGDIFSSVTSDDISGGYQALKHLLEIGRRRLAFVAGPLHLHQVRDRLAGAEKAIAEVPGATLEIISTDEATVIAGRQVGLLLTERSRESLPDGLFCTNDLVALGIMQALLMNSGPAERIRIPQDIALVGYDDIDFAISAVTPLTSVRQPTQLMGQTAIELLLEQVNPQEIRPRSVQYSPELVIRASTQT